MKFVATLKDNMLITLELNVFQALNLQHFQNLQDVFSDPAHRHIHVRDNRKYRTTWSAAMPDVARWVNYSRICIGCANRFNRRKHRLKWMIFLNGLD